MENLSATISSKFHGLLSYLTRTKETFEMVADEIEDSNLKTAFNGLSVESSQYADELSVQLKTLGIPYDSPSIFINEQTNGEAGAGDYDPDCNEGDEVMNICCTSENNITKAYREILNEYFPFTGLREVMMYQLNALKCAFMKIKLLNATRFSQ